MDSGCNLTFPKLFDLFSWDVIFTLLTECGFPQQITGTIEHAWRNMRRRFKLGLGSVGEQWDALNGALQGDANSVWIINVIISTWANERSENKPELQVRAFADDTGVIGQGTTTSEDDLLSREIEANDLAIQAKGEFDIMHGFASAIGGKINLKKTHVCGTNSIIRKALRKTGIPVMLHARSGFACHGF